MTEEQLRAACALAAEAMAEYYRLLPGRPIMPATTSRALRDLLEEPLPREGSELAPLIDAIRRDIFPNSRQNAHPRFFGYVQSPGTPAGVIGEMLAAVLNANVTCWRSAPAPTEVERIAVNWIKQILGYPPAAEGLFVSGGSMANFAGLAAARTVKAPEALQHGMGGQRLRVYVSEEAHFSVSKAAALIGIGRENVRRVATGADFRMDVAALERAIGEDLRAGHTPCCVVANAGAVSTGAFDPLGAIAAVARRHGLWLHVDGAYGGFAALAPEARPFFDAIAEADSVALDPHKWLYLPMGCGCVLYRDPAAARAAFSHFAEYTRPVGWRDDEAFAFWDYGPELSRPFRALNVWLLLKYAGTRALGEAVSRNIACARYVGRLIEASPDLELMAPVELSIFCFRVAPPGFTGDLDALNERILVELQRQGSSYLSNASLRGRFALRGCVLNYRTSEAEMERLVEDVRRAARAVLAEG